MARSKAARHLALKLAQSRATFLWGNSNAPKLQAWLRFQKIRAQMASARWIRAIFQYDKILLNHAIRANR